MIEDMFKNDEPVFVSLNGEEFIVRKSRLQTLDVSIQEMTPVRKLFENKKLKCISMDCTVSRNGRYCALCKDQFKCRRRIRIMMIIHNCGDQPCPAILEINQNSFGSLQQAIEFIGENNFPNIQILIKIAYDENGRISLRFTPAP